jgi:hypothetical protein
VEDHRKPLIGSGVTSPFALAGTWCPFEAHDGQSTYRLDPRWNLLLWYDQATDRWYVTCPGDLGYYITPDTPYWVGPAHPANGSVGDYEPGPVAGASGTLTITGPAAPVLSVAAFGIPPGLEVAGQWYVGGSYDGQDYYVRCVAHEPPWYLWWDSTEPNAWRVTNRLGSGHRTIDPYWSHLATGPEDLAGNYYPTPGGPCSGLVTVARL